MQGGRYIKKFTRCGLLLVCNTTPVDLIKEKLSDIVAYNIL